MAKFIAYYRVSTKRQGKSGLGLEAQNRAVLDFMATQGGNLDREFTEVETRKKISSITYRSIRGCVNYFAQEISSSCRKTDNLNVYLGDGVKELILLLFHTTDVHDEMVTCY